MRSIATCRTTSSRSSNWRATCCPMPTLDQKIATGFNRNHRGNSEGGIIPEEYAVEYVVDRVDTTATVFLGLTMGCARCHNHKYDPITQKEYLPAVRVLQQRARAREVPAGSATRRRYITAPTPEQQAQLKQLDDELAAANAAFAKLQPDLAQAQREWERSLDTVRRAVAWAPARGLVAHYPLDGDLQRSGCRVCRSEQHATGDAGMRTSGRADAPELCARPDRPGGELRWQELHSTAATSRASTSYGVGRGASARTIRPSPTTTRTRWPRGSIPRRATGAIVTRDEDDTSSRNGHGLNLRDGKIRVQLRDQVGRRRHPLQTEKTVSLNQWHHVTLTYDGSRWASGVKIYVDGEEWKLEILLDDVNSQGAAKRGAAADRRRRRAGEPVPGQHRRRADLQPGAVAGRGRDAGRSHARERRSPRLPEDKRTRGAGRQDPRLLPRACGSRRTIAEAWTRLIDAQATTRRVLSEPPDRHGDGGDADAARDAPADPRDVRPAGRSGHADAAGGAGRRRRRRIRRIGSAWRGGWSIRRIR